MKLKYNRLLINLEDLLLIYFPLFIVNFMDFRLLFFYADDFFPYEISIQKLNFKMYILHHRLYTRYYLRGF